MIFPDSVHRFCVTHFHLIIHHNKVHGTRTLKDVKGLIFHMETTSIADQDPSLSNFIDFAASEHDSFLDRRKFLVISAIFAFVLNGNDRNEFAVNRVHINRDNSAFVNKADKTFVVFNAFGFRQFRFRRVHWFWPVNTLCLKIFEIYSFGVTGRPSTVARSVIKDSYV